MKELPPLPSMFMSAEFPEFYPSEVDDFVGGARECAINVQKVINASLKYKLPLKFIFPGAPGVGKSSLALFILNLLKVQKWVVSNMSGPDVTIDVVRDFANRLHLAHDEMFGEYRVFVVQEVDEMPRQAQVRFLDVLDNLPKSTAVICTCNSKVDELEKRFQTRFKCLSPTAPTTAELKSLIMRWPVPESVAQMIAVGSNGNARVALLEAEEWLQTKTELVAA